MPRDGYYALTYATLLGQGTAQVRLEMGIVSGETDRGSLLDGAVRYDASRKLLQFEVAATVPANKVSITGLTTGERPRRVVFKGEAPASGGRNRFSIDFAGRAVDVIAQYIGGLDD